MDNACLNFEHCAECLKIDGCDIEAEFSPDITNEGFSCDHLQDDPCKERVAFKYSFWRIFLVLFYGEY